MDIQARVAARRQELEAASRKRAEAIKAATREAEQRELERIASELKSDAVPIAVEDGRLALAVEPTPIDANVFREGQLAKLLEREARKRWSPAENWWVIAPGAAGLALLIPLFPLGFALLVFGGLARWNFMSRYKAQLRDQYPSVFGPLPAAASGNGAPEDPTLSSAEKVGP